MTTEEELALHFFGRTECPGCGRWVLCLAHHQCAEEMARPARVPVVDREPVDRIKPKRWEPV